MPNLPQAAGVELLVESATAGNRNIAAGTNTSSIVKSNFSDLQAILPGRYMRFLLALLGLFGSVAVQADESFVSLYGQVNIGLILLNDGTTEQLRVDNLYAPSLIGFKGVAPVFADTRAWFLAETKVDPDSGQSRFADREGWLGMFGPWGKLGLGRGYSPYTNMVNQFDLFYGAIGLAINAVDKATDSGLGDGTARLSHGLRYDTPMLGGFDSAAMYSVGEVAGAAVDTRTMSIFVRQRQPLWSSFAAFHRIDNVAGAPDRNNQVGLLGGGVMLGPVALQLAAQRARLNQFTPTVNRERTGWVGTIRCPLGPKDLLTIGGMFMLQAHDNGEAVAGSDFHRSAIGVRHALGKWTHLLLEYVRQDNQGIPARQATTLGLLFAY